MIKLTGNEKAVLGGLSAFLGTTIVQIQQSGQFTFKEFLWSLGAWVVTHVTVWVTTNSPKPVSSADNTPVATPTTPATL